jgi:hypothetical protein
MEIAMVQIRMKGKVGSIRVKKPVANDSAHLRIVLSCIIDFIYCKKMLV